jgi:DNA-binding beta-propeller fold protein YncE
MMAAEVTQSAGWCRWSRRSVLGAALAALAAGCAQVPNPKSQAPFVPPVFPKPPDEPRFVYERTIYGAGDILAQDATSELRRAVTGEVRTGDTLGKPYGIAAYQGRIYVTDTVQRFVLVLDVPNGLSYRIGDGEGASALVKPLGIDVDAQGRVYVADISQRQVVIYDPLGGLIKKIGGEKHFDRLTSVTVNPEGTLIYAVDIGGVDSDRHVVKVFDVATGEHKMDIGKRGVGPGEFNLPRDLAIGQDGKLYVVDGGNFRVVVFDRNGKYLQSFGSVGRQLGQFSRPKEIAADPHGNVYVVDTAFGNFQIFNADGELLLFVGTRDERDGPARYMLPSGIAVDEDGRVYVVDQWFRKIDVYRPANLRADEGALGRRPAAPRR